MTAVAFTIGRTWYRYPKYFHTQNCIYLTHFDSSRSEKLWNSYISEARKLSSSLSGNQYNNPCRRLGQARTMSSGTAVRGIKGGSSRVVNEEQVVTDGCRWIKLNKIAWIDPEGKDRTWESCVRANKKSLDAADAVAVFARLKAGETFQGTSPPVEKTVLVAQFRPPVHKVTLELPAGLIDDGETPEEAALRELKEETGYCGSVRRVSPVVFSSPGLTNESMQLVEIDVDIDTEENRNPICKQEEGEFIERIEVPINGTKTLLESIMDIKKERGFEVDARLWSLAAGMGMNS